MSSAWDPEHPPARPPHGADPLLWRLARDMHRDHQPLGDGFCRACRGFWPCVDRQLADIGLVEAFRRPAVHDIVLPEPDPDDP